MIKFYRLIGCLLLGFSLFFSYQLSALVFQKTGEADGLPQIAINHIIQNRSGAVWLASNDGINRYDPQKNLFNLLNKKYSLEGQEYNTGAYFKNIDSRLYFVGLASGKFLLQLKKIEKSNIDENSVTSLAINLFPPWWRSTIAYFSYFIFIVLMFSFIYWRRIIRLRRQTELLQSEISQCTQKLDQALAEKKRVFTYILHKFRTPDILISDPVTYLLEKAQDSSSTHAIKTIKNQNKYLLSIVNILLGISETDNALQKIKTLSPDQRLGDIVSHVQLLTIAKDIHFISNIEETLSCRIKQLSVEQIESTEQCFMDKLNNILESHYSEQSCQTSFLASELAVSERQLQRKFKAITNITPAQFIRNWRLNKSKSLLLSGYPIGNIALDCGFNSQAYFTKCFKEMYAETPTDFIAKQR